MTDKKEQEYKSIADVMHHIQMNLKVPKGQTNKFGGYKYRNLEDIKEGLKKILEDIKGCYITENDEVFFIQGRFYIKSTVTLTWYDKHISTTGYAREEEGKKGMDGSQLTGAASSYARKYAYNALFGIDDTKDADSMDNAKDNSPCKGTGNRTFDKAIKEKAFGIQQCTNMQDLEKGYNYYYKQFEKDGATEDQLALLTDAYEMKKGELENRMMDGTSG